MVNTTLYLLLAMLIVVPAQQTIAMYHNDSSSYIELEEEEESKTETENEKESEKEIDIEDEKVKQHFRYSYKNLKIKEPHSLCFDTQLFFSNYCVEIHLPPPEVIL